VQSSNEEDYNGGHNKSPSGSPRSFVGRRFLWLCKKNAPGKRRENPWGRSGTDTWAYYLRHWFTRYGIASSLHIVLRYKQTKATPKDGQCEGKLAAQRPHKEDCYIIAFSKDLLPFRFIQIRSAAIRSKAPDPYPAGMSK